MVWDNPFQQSNTLNTQLGPSLVKPASQHQPNRHASLSDRILSWILDLLIFLPFINLFLFKILQQFRDADWVFEPLSTSWWLSKIIYGFYVFIMLTLVQAVFWTWKQQTLGQKFFRLSVKNNDPETPLSFNRALLRSFTLNLSLLAAGIPLASMLSHKNKLGLHDLVSETWVESAQPSWFSANQWPWVAPLTRSFYSFVTALVFLALFVFLGALEQGLIASQDSDADTTKLVVSDECQTTGLGVNEVDGLLSGYLSGTLEKKCLEHLETPEVIGEDLSPFLVFAKYLQFENEPELRQRYKQKACEQNQTGGACVWIEIREKNPLVSKPFSSPEYALDWLLQYQYGLYYSDQVQLQTLLTLPMSFQSTSLSRGQFEWIKLGADRVKTQSLFKQLNIVISNPQLNKLVCQWDQVHHCQAAHQFAECQDYFSSQYPQGQISTLEDQWLFVGYQTCQGNFAQAIKTLGPLKSQGLQLLKKQILVEKQVVDKETLAQIFSSQTLSPSLRVRLVKIWQPLLEKNSSLDRGLASEPETN